MAINTTPIGEVVVSLYDELNNKYDFKVTSYSSHDIDSSYIYIPEDDNTRHIPTLAVSDNNIDSKITIYKLNESPSNSLQISMRIMKTVNDVLTFVDYGNTEIYSFSENEATGKDVYLDGLDIDKKSTGLPYDFYEMTLSLGNQSKTIYIWNKLYYANFYPRTDIYLGKDKTSNTEIQLKPLTTIKPNPYYIVRQRLFIDDASNYWTYGDFRRLNLEVKLKLSLIGNAQDTRIFSLDDCPGFVCQGRLNGVTAYPVLGAAPLNPDLLHNNYQANKGTQMIFEYDSSGSENLTTAYGTLFILNLPIGGPRFWSKSDAENWMNYGRSVDEMLYKYRSLNPKQYDGFTDLGSFMVGATAQDGYYTYYRILYDAPVAEVSYKYNTKLTFVNDFPLVQVWDYSGNNTMWELSNRTVITWVSKIGNNKFTTNSSNKPIESDFHYFYFEAENDGYLVQFNTNECFNTIDPIYRLSTEASDTVKNIPMDIYIVSTNRTLDFWTSDGGFVYNQVGAPTQEIPNGAGGYIAKSGFLTPVFMDSNCVNCLYVLGWINKEIIDSDIEIGKFCKVTPSLRYALEIPSYDSLYKYFIDPTINTYAEAPYKLYKVFDISDNFVKIGFWVKVEPWIYNNYWKPAPTAIFDNNEQTQWAKSF